MFNVLRFRNDLAIALNFVGKEPIIIGIKIDCGFYQINIQQFY